MSCELTKRFVPAYMDGELELVRAIEVEAHLKDCRACAQNLENQQELSVALPEAECHSQRRSVNAQEPIDISQLPRKTTFGELGIHLRSQGEIP